MLCCSVRLHCISVSSVLFSSCCAVLCHAVCTQPRHGCRHVLTRANASLHPGDFDPCASMLCCAMLCYATLSCAAVPMRSAPLHLCPSWRMLLCCVVLIPYHSIQFHAVPCCVVLPCPQAQRRCAHVLPGTCWVPHGWCVWPPVHQAAAAHE